MGLLEQDKIILSTIVKCNWFEGIPESALEKLAAEARIKYYTKQSYLYRIEEFSREIYCIIAGRVRIRIRGMEGQEFGLTDLGPQTWVGDGALLNDTPRVLDAMVIEAGDMLVIPRDALLELGEEHPVLYRNLFKVATARAQDTYSMVGYALFLPLRARLAGRFLELVQEHGKESVDGILVDATIRQNDFACLSLGSRQHVNKIFREWTKLNVIKNENGKYSVLDLDALKEEALYRPNS
ncbi:MAG: Crp/Fnr family transcriptional regulator [Halioglobus sp.]